MRRLLAICGLAACALTSKSEPREVRYFAPPLTPVAAATGTTCARVRLGRVVASDQLRAPIEHRVSPVEVVPSDSLRWTDRPEVYARRAIGQAVYARPLEQAVAGPGLVLDVDLTAFEEVSRGGRVALRYVVRDDLHAVATGALDVERPARDATVEASVTAIGDALAAASDELATRVLAAACPR